MADAAYARYSSHKQDDGTSLDVQLDACRRAAGGPCREYVDKAKTGRARAGREALGRLLDDAEAGLITRVFVYRWDRLGRSLAETAAVVADLEDRGIEVVSTSEGRDVLARGMHFVISEHYSRALAERTRDGMKKRFEQRLWTGGRPPFGYEVVPDSAGRRRLAIREGEAQVVREIFRLYQSEPMGYKEIAQHLNSHARPARMGDGWSHSTVRQVLTNRFLLGEISFNRRRCRLNKSTGRRTHVKNDGKDRLSYRDEALRIIPDQQFEAVQSRIAERSLGPQARGPRQMRPFTGLIRCGCCGEAFYSRASKNARGEYRYYNCGRRQRRGPDACVNGVAIREDFLLGKLQDAFAGVFDDVEGIVEEAVREAEKLIASEQDEAQSLRRQVAESDRKIRAIADRILDPDIDPAAKRPLSRLLAEEEARREKAQEALAGLAAKAVAGTGMLAGAVRKALAEAKENLSSVASPAQLNEFVREFVGPLTVGRDGTLSPITEPAPEASKAAGAGVPGLVAGVGFEPTTSGL